MCFHSPKGVQEDTLKVCNFTKNKLGHRWFDNDLQKNFRTNILENDIIVEDATSIRIKRQDEQIWKQSRIVAENNSSKNDAFIRANTVPGEKSYPGAVTPRDTKNGTTKQVVVFGVSSET